MHADLHPGNFLLLPGGRLGTIDFGAVTATPGGIPAPFGQLAAAVIAGDGPGWSAWPGRPAPSPPAPRSTRG
jgi:predicted unusual protein kinase regulating ubiquinone biosynthesis (AarF/ABC1/UbiB family)